MNKYSLIYADPSWSYDNKGSRATADSHYSTMSITDLKRLPVWDLAADDCVLAMWWVPPMPLEAIQLTEAWGFKLKNMCLFTWAKLNQCAEQHITKAIQPDKKTCKRNFNNYADFMRLLNDQTRMGLGNYSRSNSESCLVAVRGKGLERLDAAVKQMIYAPIGEHSAKPEEARHRLERLYGDVPRIELFSRSAAPGWHHWGNENPRNDIALLPGTVMGIDWANDNNPLKREA